MKNFEITVWDDENGESTHTVTAETKDAALDHLAERVPWQEVRSVEEVSYAHVFTLAFEAKSGSAAGEDVTGEMLRKALLERLKMSDEELVEACGSPEQSMEDMD